MPLNIEKFKEEFKRGVQVKGNGDVINEKVKNTVVEFTSKERDYKEVVKEIKDLGKQLVDSGKNVDAIAIVNNRLGKDDNGVQRTLEQCSQANLQMLEVIVEDLKKLLK